MTPLQPKVHPIDDATAPQNASRTAVSRSETNPHGIAAASPTAAPDRNASVALVVDLRGSDAELVDTIHSLRSQLDDAQALIIYLHDETDAGPTRIRRGCVYVTDDSHANDIRVGVHRLHGEECGAIVPTLAPGHYDVTVKRQPRGNLQKLTPREREVLALIADGKTSKAIASSLEISPRTVGAHRSSLMKKLRIHSVAGLVRFAMQEGMLDLASE